MNKDIEKKYFKDKLNKSNPIIFDIGAFDGNDCLAFLTIKLFMKWISTASLKIFVFYRIILGVLILIYAYF